MSNVSNLNYSVIHEYSHTQISKKDTIERNIKNYIRNDLNEVTREVNEATRNNSGSQIKENISRDDHGWDDDEDDNRLTNLTRHEANLLRNKKSTYWVPDDTVTHCTTCGVEFTMWVRKHHCKLCLMIYCWKCTPHRKVIPNYLLHRDDNPVTMNEAIDRTFGHLFRSFGSSGQEEVNNVGNKSVTGKGVSAGINDQKAYQQRLCDQCNSQIEMLMGLDELIQVFTLIMPDIDMLNRMAGVCRMWNYLVQYFKGKIRNIQYCRFNQGLNSFERKLLWVNREYWIGHSHYCLALIKSLDFQSYHYQTAQHRDFIKWIDDLIINDKMKDKMNNKIDERSNGKYSCLDLMCTRNCCHSLSSAHAVILIDIAKRGSVCVELSDFILLILMRMSDHELLLYLPYLTERLIDFRVDTRHSWGIFLIDRSVGNHYLALEFYWNLMYLERTTRHPIYRYYLTSLMNYASTVSVDVINRSFKFVRILENIPGARAKSGSSGNSGNSGNSGSSGNNNGNNSGIGNELIGGGVGPGYGSDLMEVKSYLRKQNFDNLVMPFDAGITVKSLIVHGVSVKDSYTAPVLLPFECNLGGSRNTSIKRVLYKFEGVRTDYLVLKVIKLMNHLLETFDGLNLETVDYRVLPLSKDAGLIEVVEDCSTAYEIKERMKFTIWNYIVENNPDQTVEALRRKFVRSCATYCVLTYLLGVGDRHLDNIMITTDGRLFHIDYGFILGADPKPITQPKIRITPDMVDALGGHHSVYYNKFLKLCNKIFQSLRCHLNLIICNLSLLTSDRKEYDNLVELLSNRFMTGETGRAAVIQLEMEILRSSTHQNLGEHIVDMFHYHNKERTLQSVVHGTVSGAGTIVKGAGNIGRRAGNFILERTGWK
jgi:uncharacterized membrane protein YgcG